MPEHGEDKAPVAPRGPPGDATLPPESTATAQPGAAAPLPTPVVGGGSEWPVSHWERYELLALLGRGGMGEVYKARDRRLGRTVALKFIRGANPDRVMRFLQEARSQARIDHPHVCKVYEVGEVQAKAYIAMQFIDGQRLDEAAPGMSLPEKVRVMGQVAMAVHEAHRLGVIHRDLKPSNILLARDEEGRCYPVVMDFGLAYDAGDGHGLTETGALLGTPSYMAPEQARGELRSIDRRSDVYSLGATLYELLTGVAPFTDATAVGILAKVLHEEPPSPRVQVPQLERDLETLVLKCLSKEPHLRYASARALAEDLGRYLDGEPIVGQRPSLLSRWRRQARRHRALVAVSAVSLASILVLGAFGVSSWLEARRTQRQSARRVRLAEQLGQQVKELEWFLRTTYTLPLHDTEPERQLVRERMRRIASQRHELDVQGEGLIHYALGRGHLALRELEQAHEELSHARRKGLDSPELHYALGQVLGALYHQALEDARRGGEKGWVAERRRALERQYLEPALQSLERSRELELESPDYLEGLMAFYREQYDAAARAAERAVARAPWLYEAHKLAGDVASARAVERLEHGDYEAARAGFQEAEALYARAIESGRSDAGNYDALAQLWLQQADVAQQQGRPEEEALRRALEASDKAIQSASQHPAGYTRKAYALMRRYQRVNAQGGTWELASILTEWISAGTRAVQLDPRDVYTHDALGIGYYTRGLYAARTQRDPHPSWNEAIARLNRALELQPDYPWGLNDLGLVHFDKGNYLLQHGEDPRAEYAEAARCFSRAGQFDPRYLYAFSNLTVLYNAMAAYELSRGLDPEEQVRQALQAGERSLSLNPNFYAALNGMTVAHLLSAQYLLESGGDPRPRLERALQHVEHTLRINPTAGRSHLYQARAHHLVALHAMRDGGDATGALEVGLQAVERSYRHMPGCVECRVMGARVALTAAQWAKRRGRPQLPLLQRALSEARRAVELYPYHETHHALARACWSLVRAQPPGTASRTLAEGLAQVERALHLSPNLAHAHAVHGGLLLARAQVERSASARLQTLLKARSAFERAFQLNPLLRREYEVPLREVELLLARREAARPAR